MPRGTLGRDAGFTATARARRSSLSAKPGRLQEWGRVGAAGSWLRRVDPRTKLALSFALSAAVALPLLPLGVVGVCFAGLLAGVGLASQAAAQLWRARLWFALLFGLDWLFIGLDFAALITLRLALLSSAFILVFATTTADELRAAGERLGLPAQVAFAFATAVRSLALVEREWEGIIEAQRARGIGAEDSGKRRWRLRRADLTSATALVVPAIVLAAQRAWALSEAAAARGFESPLRQSSRTLRLGALDHLVLIGTALVLGGAFLLR